MSLDAAGSAAGRLDAVWLAGGFFLAGGTLFVSAFTGAAATGAGSGAAVGAIGAAGTSTGGCVTGDGAGAWTGSVGTAFAAVAGAVWTMPVRVAK
jgi:hypothetical protein